MVCSLPSLTLSFFLVLQTLCAPTWSNPVNPTLRPHVIEDIALGPRQANDYRQSTNPPFRVTGVRDGGPPQPRLEIRQLQQEPDQWNLYLLALDRMQKADQSNELSYYQIAGIHGLPYTAWDGVERDPDGEGGYCMHGSNVFLTWHRPYLALFEQILYANMLDVVASFRNTSRYDFYVNAARTFRMPYWDWAAAPPEGENNFPNSLTIRDVQVTLPNGTAVIPNPLYAYRFHPVPSDFSPWISEIPWIMQNMTLRQPDPPRARRPPDGNDIVVQRMNTDRLMLRDRLYIVLTTYDNFTDAGTEAWKADNALKWDSLEAVHNVPHNNIGGHMWYLAWSAFDPVFWLHHTMVDRTLAMWQALYPDSYVEPMAQTQPSWSYPVGTVLDASSPLTPFHSDSSGAFWTSESARSTLTFGYTYPELGTGNDTAALRRAINELYGPSTAMSPQKRDSLRKRQRADGCDESTADDSSQSCSPPVTREYLVNIKAQKFGLGSSTVYVFLGNPSADSASWWNDNTLAGTYAMFAMPNSTCESCMRVQAAGTVPLSTVLEAKVAAGELGGLDESIVVPYLQRNLQWRITKVDGTEVPAAQVPDFKIAIVSTEVMPPTAMSEFPTWSSEYTVHDEITGGKPGGFTAGDVI